MSNEPMPSVASFVVSASEGKIDFGWFFFGKTVETDAIFREAVNSAGWYRQEGFACHVFQTAKSQNSDDFIRSVMHFDDKADGNRICALLSYLGSKDCSVLDIPIGQDTHSVSLIVSYVAVQGTLYVLFVEHLFENGREKVNLKARELNLWDATAPMVAIMD